MAAILQLHYKCIFLNENAWISLKISLEFVPKVPINNIPALVQIMAWHRPGDKPLFKPMMVSLLMHICVIRPQWVNPILLHQVDITDGPTRGPWSANTQTSYIALPYSSKLRVYDWDHVTVWIQWQYLWDQLDCGLQTGGGVIFRVCDIYRIWSVLLWSPQLGLLYWETLSLEWGKICHYCCSFMKCLMSCWLGYSKGMWNSFCSSDAIRHFGQHWFR